MTVAIRVIPCLDVDAGRVVKGVNFENLRDAGDPVELAARYDTEGADELTFLDVSASSGNRETTYDVVRRTAEQVFVPLTVGGGVRSADDVDRLLRAGADKVGVNTAAIARPELIAEIADRFGSQVLVLSVDARRTTGDVRTESGYEVTTHGGRRGTGIDAVEWASRAAGLGAGRSCSTRWTRTAPPPASTSRCSPRCARRCACPSSRAAARARPSTSWRRRAPGRTRCSPRASSTSAPSPSAR